jgi:SPP1 family predicted phage head-tail adaptor
MRRSGQRRHLVEIQERTPDEQDSVGQPIPNWHTIGTRMSKVEPLNGREYFSAQQIVAEVNTRFEFDYYPTLTALMRLRVKVAPDEWTVYDIKDIIDVEMRHVTHVIMTKAGVIASANV